MGFTRADQRPHAVEDLDLHGESVAAGEQFVTLLGAANRDPRMFDGPERFDVGRVGAAPMSFGGGIHFCLGAALARAEGYVVFDRLLDRFSVIEPAWGDRPAPRARSCCTASNRCPFSG